MEITEKMKITNRLGLHLRAAAEFVKISNKFKSWILVKNHHHSADGKSIINLMMLAAACGSELTITFQGEDAWDARSAIRDLVLSKFGEKE
jgi:phosphocarrier protein HPr